MKYLKISDNKGFFFKVGEDNSQWIEIDKITKEDLLYLLEKAVSEEFEMNAFEEELIRHKAHQIVYKSISEKFNDLIKNKKSFADECDSQFISAIEKYESKIQE